MHAQTVQRNCAWNFLSTSALIVCLCLAGGSAAAAQEESQEASTGPKITLHGFLTQAYARSDGNQVLGIPEEGTADYRTAALQFRADVTESDVFAIQLSHERFGESNVAALHQDVELDWVFYERRFGQSSVKVGRVQLPFGIYNEVRDVGTILPFYRPSANFYGEGSYTSETVDGVVLSHTFGAGGVWQLEGDLHFGNREYISNERSYQRRKVRDSFGVELWLQTPVPGLRIGAGGMRYDVVDREATESTAYHISVEAAFGRFLAHTEIKRIDFQVGSYDAGYAHLGFRATDKLTLNAQYDYSDLELEMFRLEADIDDDFAAGVSYAFRPDNVLKLEHHWDEGYKSDKPRPSVFGPNLETQYWIVSFSTSF